MKSHKGITANTTECFSTFIGCKIVGVLFNALPLGDRSLAAGTKTLVFEDGYGLTISGSGSFWTETPDTIRRAVAVKKTELKRAQDELGSVLKLAGA